MFLTNLFGIGAVIGAGIAVAIADALLKQATAGSTLWQAMRHPLMIPIALLYALQILLFLYAFVHHWNLSVLGILQMTFYAVTVVLVGIFWFEEKLTLLQGIGIVFALIGIFLINA